MGEIIRSCGLYQTKARDLVACAKMLVEEYGGRVPDTMEALTRLPGVGRKTANLILGDIFHKPAIVADTHCIRIAGRLGLTDGTKDPLKVGKAAAPDDPPRRRGSDFCHRLVLHGRALCMGPATPNWRRLRSEGRLRLRQVPQNQITFSHVSPHSRAGGKCRPPCFCPPLRKQAHFSLDAHILQ